jgi:hypothetical protein
VKSALELHLSHPSAETLGVMKSSLAACVSGSDSGSTSEGDDTKEKEAAKVCSGMHAERQRDVANTNVKCA